MLLPVERMAWLLVELHRVAGRLPPTKQIAQDLAVLGPVLSWQPLQTIRGFGRRRQAHLQAVFGSEQLSRHLSLLLETMTHTEALPSWKAPAVSPTATTAPQWPCLPEPPPYHPLGEDARFPPLVAQALGGEKATVYGEPCSLAGFSFSSQIVHFREAIKRATPDEAVVIGGGYVGAEVALAWSMAGATVTLIERSTRLLPEFFDREIETVQSLLENSGVCLRMETEAVRWTQHRGKIVVEYSSKGIFHQVNADLVLVAVGVRRP